MKADTYTLRAHGKVNLGLAVLTRRGDGFHEIETLMAPVDLHDDVVVAVGAPEPAEEPASGAETAAGVEGRILVAGRSDGAVGAQELDWGADNLAHRAAAAYLTAYAGRSAGVVPAVSVQVVKRLPVAAGMGGGSSDAAAVLRALHRSDGEAQPTGRPLVSAAELQALALGLGSDVSFFLASTAAVARGRGERLAPVSVPPLELVLVNPRIAISAAAAYRELVGFTPRLREARALDRWHEGLDPGWSNGLQPGVLRMHPELREVLSTLRAAGLKGVLMSGSGATCFGLARAREEAESSAAEIAVAHPEWWVATTTTLA